MRISIRRRFGLLAAFLTGATGFAQNGDPFPTPASKKGLQVQMIDDAIALGTRHATLNCDVTALHELTPNSESPRHQLRGREYFFRAQRIAALDAQIKTLSDAGVVVYLILLAYESGESARDAISLHPGYERRATRNRLAAFNTVTPEGRAHLQAVIEFLANRYNGDDPRRGRVWGYIIGNEANAHWWWYNLGRASVETVADAYESAVRLAHAAVRTASQHARVYISLEHHWTIRYPAGDVDQAAPGRALLEAFARLAEERGDFDWHVAYHPYPENLRECRFWNDKTAIDSTETPRITMKNIEVLPRYLQQTPLLYRGSPRHVILSEQGFHTAERPEGERDQAAAFAAAWHKVARLAGIDAFIYHRHVDHAAEGLDLGLWTRKPGTISTPDRPKKIREVFAHADREDWESAFAFALPVLDIKSWTEFAPAAQ